MITTQDYRYELMINPKTGELFKRALEKEEIFEFINDKYSDDEAFGKLNALEKAGLTYEDIITYALRQGV